VEIEESIRARTEAEAMEKAEAKAKTKEEKRAKRRLKKLQKGKKPSKEMLKAIYAELEEEGIDLPEAADAVEADAVLTEAVDENAQNPHASEIEIPTLGEDLEQEARKKDSWKRPKLDFKTARFYIPEALKYRAEIRFERRGSGWAPAVAAGILMVFATALICHFLPYVIGLVDVTISFFAP